MLGRNQIGLKTRHNNVRPQPNMINSNIFAKIGRVQPNRNNNKWLMQGCSQIGG